MSNVPDNSISMVVNDRIAELLCAGRNVDFKATTLPWRRFVVIRPS